MESILEQSFFTKCQNCQQVKAEHRKPRGLINEIGVSTLKWEEINMEFVVGFSRTRRKTDSIWVIVDRLTKSAHFILFKSTNTAKEYSRMYIDEIVSLHGVPLSIIWDRGAEFA